MEWDVNDNRAFELTACRYFSDVFAVPLQPRVVTIAGSVEKSFDLVGMDGRFVGDAKWYKANATPAAKWSTIAEYVWPLQRVDADRVFLVFGNDPVVPERWLHRFRPLADPVEVYVLDSVGHRRL